MSEQTTDYSPLNQEQLAALNDEQKQIFTQLESKDRQFYAENFSPKSLGAALGRKWEIMQKHARRSAFEQKVQAEMAEIQNQTEDDVGLSTADIGAGAAGIAGAVGLGVLAKKIAPDGKANWRGVSPRDLVEPLVSTFARQEKTDIRFEAPTQGGVTQATVLLRTPTTLVPGLTIILTPFEEKTEVQISKLSSEGVMQTIKEGGSRLFDLLADGVRAKRRQDVGGLLDLAGKAIEDGVDIAQMVKDLDLEDKAWQAIKNAADPLQAIYDQKMAIENEKRHQLELLWDDYYTCPKCRVEFGAEDVECRVCGAERPDIPSKADPRRKIK
jgi:hypothetical protein